MLRRVIGGIAVMVAVLVGLVSVASAAAPAISATEASRIGSSSATLSAQLNPEGEATTYRFEYGDQGPCESNPCASVPVPDASAGLDAGPVSQSVDGLTPATTYHFRLVAINGSGASNGSDAMFTTYPAPPTFAPCPNAAFRTEAGSHLPDCRAYEQTTPVAKDGGDVGGSLMTMQASPSGDAVSSVVMAGMPGGVGAENWPQYVSIRGASGWSTRGMYTPPSFGTKQTVIGWTPDLEYVFNSTGFIGNFPVKGTGLLSNQLSDGSVQMVVPEIPGAKYTFVGSSADDSKLLFEVSGAGITENAAPEMDNLYMLDRTSGSLSLVGVLPETQGGAAPAGGSFAGAFNWFYGTNETTLAEGGANIVDRYYSQDEHTLSADGDKAFFTAGGTGQIYMRRGLTGPAPETVQISASQRETPDPNGTKPAIFMRATPSGSKVFFTSCEKLTNDSTAASTGENTCSTEEQGQDLYVYDTESGVLTDLTHDSSDPHGADVRGVVGVSDDGSYVYFAANGDLDGSGPGELGDCKTVATLLNDACSLYLYHDGATTFIAHMDLDQGGGGIDPSRSDAMNWVPTVNTGINDAEATGRVTPDGRTLLYRTQDQPGTNCGALRGCVDFYRYRVGDPGPTCVSCNPSGAAPIGEPTLKNIALGAVGIIGGSFLTRNLSADGERIFFQTADKLVAADTNGNQGCPFDSANPGGERPTCEDVYEWEADGAGSCHSSQANGGCLYLLTTGMGPNPSYFVDASASGDDVFLVTHESLVPADRDEIGDIYDVRVGGGLASQHPSVLPSCTGEGCQGPPSSEPSVPTAASVTFTGPGNAATSRSAGKESAVKVSTRAVRGPSFLLKIIVPSGGHITVGGAGVGTAKSTVAKAGAYSVRVTLTRKMKKTLARRHRLVLTLHVQFAGSAGGTSKVTVALAVRRPPNAAGTTGRRRTKSKRGGVR